MPLASDASIATEEPFLGYEPNRGSLYRVLKELLAEKLFAVEGPRRGDDLHEVRSTGSCEHDPGLGWHDPIRRRLIRERLVW
jgi:hypothetical protein